MRKLRLRCACKTEHRNGNICCHYLELFSVRLILINILIGLLVAIIAQGKGHPFLRWWINGAIWGPLGLIYVIFLKRREMPNTAQENQVACPHCGKMVLVNLSPCPYCEKKIDIVDL